MQGYWVERGPEVLPDEGGPDVSAFVVTPAVRRHLRSVARAVTQRKFPVLLQGPTSSGKTTLVQHLAAVTGHTCVRINNHEHTDLQEYLGCYVSDERGRLAFQVCTLRIFLGLVGFCFVRPFKYEPCGFLGFRLGIVLCALFFTTGMSAWALVGHDDCGFAWDLDVLGTWLVTDRVGQALVTLDFTNLDYF